MAKLKPNQFILSGHLITEIPLLFQTEMVKANMEDRKTQTRREFNQPSYLTNESQSFKGMGFVNGNPSHYAASIGTENFSTLFKSPYGKPGDLLWVRETWLKLDRDHVITSEYAYKANGDSDTEDLRKDYIKSGRKYNWKPSIHMPKAASRLWLMVEEIRVERLQDITEEDAMAEGIEKVNIHGQDSWKRYDGYALVTSSPIVSYWSLWASINGEESWNSNPWVWVIKYRILSKTGRPSDDLILENYNQITQNL